MVPATAGAPSNENVYGPVPPAEVIVMLPLLTPAQEVAVAEVVAGILPLKFTVTLTVLLQPAEASVTVIVCGPAATLVNVYGLGPTTGAPPSNTYV